MARQMASLASLQQKLRGRLVETRDARSGGWGEHPGGTVSTLNTAEVILALRSTDLPAGLEPIQSAKEFLLTAKAGMMPPDSGAWPRKVHDGETERLVPDLMRTCLIITALLDTGIGIEESEVKTAIEWVLARQGADGDAGWAYQRGQKSEILPTCFAFLTLMQAAESGVTNPWRGQIERGVVCILRLRNRNGSFGA